MIIRHMGLQIVLLVSVVLIWQAKAESKLADKECTEPSKIKCKCGGTIRDVYVDSCRIPNKASGVCQACPGACDSFSRCVTCSVDGCLTCPEGRRGQFCEIEDSKKGNTSTIAQTKSPNGKSETKLPEEKSPEASTLVPSIPPGGAKGNFEITFHLTRSKIKNKDAIAKDRKMPIKMVPQTKEREDSKKKPLSKPNGTEVLSKKVVHEKDEEGKVLASAQKSSDTSMDKPLEENYTHRRVAASPLAEPAKETDRADKKPIKQIEKLELSKESDRPPSLQSKATATEKKESIESVASETQTESDISEKRTRIETKSHPSKQRSSVNNKLGMVPPYEMLQNTSSPKDNISREAQNSDTVEFFVKGLHDLMEIAMNQGSKTHLSKHAQDHESIHIASPKLSSSKSMKHPFQSTYKSISIIPVPAKSEHRNAQFPNFMPRVYLDLVDTKPFFSSVNKADNNFKPNANNGHLNVHHPHENHLRTNYLNFRKLSEQENPGANNEKKSHIPKPLYALLDYFIMQNQPLVLLKYPVNFFNSPLSRNLENSFNRGFPSQRHQDQVLSPNLYHFPTMQHTIHQPLVENPFVVKKIDPSERPPLGNAPRANNAFMPVGLGHKPGSGKVNNRWLPVGLGYKPGSGKVNNHFLPVGIGNKPIPLPILSNKTNSNSTLTQESPINPPKTLTNSTISNATKEKQSNRPDKIKFTVINDDEEGSTVSVELTTELATLSSTDKAKPKIEDLTSDEMDSAPSQQGEAEMKLRAYDEDAIIASKLEPKEHLFRVKRRATSQWCQIKQMVRHGDLDCTIWSYQKICRLRCHPGYSAPTETFRCTPNKKWDPPLSSCKDNARGRKKESESFDLESRNDNYYYYDSY